MVFLFGAGRPEAPSVALMRWFVLVYVWPWQIGKSYAGRASASPCLDLMMTLLSMGGAGWRRLLREREELVGQFR